MVCKHKRKEYQSVVAITEQVLDMDPNNVKALYFRGIAFLELQDYKESVESLQKLVHVDPTHVDGRAYFEKAKKARKDFLDSQHKKFSKMFQ